MVVEGSSLISDPLNPVPLLEGWTPYIEVSGVRCDLGFVVPPSSLTFSCAGGVPRSSDPHEIELLYYSDDPTQEGLKRAWEGVPPIELAANPINVPRSDSPNNLRVSFKGGAKYEITGDGLTSTLT